MSEPLVHVSLRALERVAGPSCVAPHGVTACGIRGRDEPSTEMVTSSDVVQRQCASITCPRCQLETRSSSRNRSGCDRR